MTHGDDRRLDFLKLYFQVSRQRDTSLYIFIQEILSDLTVTLDRGYLLSGYRELQGEREYKRTITTRRIASDNEYLLKCNYYTRRQSCIDRMRGRKCHLVNFINRNMIIMSNIYTLLPHQVNEYLEKFYKYQ